MINQILQNYSQFFNFNEMISELFTFNSLAIILTLVILEGLLSADNSLLLAMMVKHLDEKDQKKALTYGIWGAYLFRFLAIGVGTYLIRLWWVKLIGALYLLYMVYSHFSRKGKKNGEVKTCNKGLWATIASVELMDIAFSIDSVTSAFGVSNKVWVLFLGSILGILMMRSIATVFVKLIDKYPELENSAFVLIALIGIRMALEIFHINIPDIIFFVGLIVVMIGGIVIHNLKERNQSIEND